MARRGRKSESVRKYKYNAHPQVIDGRKFASKKEARRYLELKAMQAAGEIGNLKCQVKFELIERQVDDDGKFLFHPINYFADFTYYDKNGNYIVEDTKGVKTEVFRIKEKLMFREHRIKIKVT